MAPGATARTHHCKLYEMAEWKNTCSIIYCKLPQDFSRLFVPVATVQDSIVGGNRQLFVFIVLPSARI